MCGSRLHHEKSLRLNPISGAEANAERRSIVLQYMYDQDYIDKQELEEALANNA